MLFDGILLEIHKNLKWRFSLNEEWPVNDPWIIYGAAFMIIRESFMRIRVASQTNKCLRRNTNVHEWSTNVHEYYYARSMHAHFLTLAIRHQNSCSFLKSVVTPVPPYGSTLKYGIFLRHPNHLPQKPKTHCLLGFWKMSVLRNVKTAEVRK